MTLSKRLNFSNSPYNLPIFCIVSLLVLSNVVVLIYYRNRTYPNSSLAGQHLGTISYNHTSAHFDKSHFLPKSLVFKTDKLNFPVSVKQLGILIDDNALIKNINKKQFLPLLDFVSPHKFSLPIKINQSTFNNVLDSLGNKVNGQPINSRIELRNDKFVITKSESGSRLDVNKTKSLILIAINGHQPTVSLTFTKLAPTVTDKQLTAELQNLEAMPKVHITFSYGSNSISPSSSTIISWLVASNNSYVVSEANVQAYILGLGNNYNIRVTNADNAVEAVKKALATNTTLTYVLEAAPTPQYVNVASKSRPFSYCVRAKGIDDSNLPELESKLRAVYGDNRGWSLNGKVSFSEVPSNCNFTVWLSDSSLMPTFGSICDSEYSCTVSPNVILNFDRWRSATDAWNQSGSSLDDYRTMVINHETGHMLGFYHKYCAGPGQPAPVMQQQSISLQGCSANPWPLPSEQTQLQIKLGV